MNVKNLEKKENNTATIKVEVEAEAFEKALTQAYQKQKANIYIAGFRKGKAPRAIVEGMYGSDVFYNDAIEIIAPEALSYAVESENLKTVGMPAFEDYNVAEDKTVEFTFSVTLYPEATLGQYKEIELEKDTVEVTEEQVNEQLESVKKRNARMVSVERAAELGDTTKIDFEGFLDGVPFDGGKADGFDLELGSGSFVPGFEDQVVGMSVGEEKEINITFPENYTPDLAGKDVVFKVKVNEISMPEYPELDDEFAKDVSEFDTIDEYKADIKKNLEESKKNEIDAQYRSNLLKLASDNMTVDVPSVMIEDKVSELVRNYAANFGVQGGDIPTEKLIEMLGIDEAAMSQSIRPAAEYQVKVEILLDAVVKAENIEVSEEEANEYIEGLAKEYNAKAEDLEKYFGRELMINEHKKEKAVEIIVDSAKDVKGKKMPVEATEEVAE